MKKKNGFTLVELMAVIAILAIILAIVVPKVFRSVDESKKRACNIQLTNIKDAAATYFTKYRYNNSDNGVTYDEEAKGSDGTDITLSMLINASLLKGTINNPITDKPLDQLGTKVNIKNVDEVFTYTVYVYDTSVSSWKELFCQ